MVPVEAGVRQEIINIENAAQALESQMSAIEDVIDQSGWITDKLILNLNMNSGGFVCLQ
jgi:hypothetical protein